MMKSILILLAVVVLVLSACSPQPSQQEVPPPPSPTSTQTETPTPAQITTPLQASLTGTPALQPVATEIPVASPIPSETQVAQNLELALQNWLNGTITINEEELVTLPTGEHLPLGTTRETDVNRQQAAAYQGVFLGHRIIGDQIVLMVGFESKDGIRYAIPFNAGPLEFTKDIANEFYSTLGNFENGKWSSYFMTGEQLAANLSNIPPGKPIFFLSVVYFENPDSLLQEKKDIYDVYAVPIPISREVYNFIYRATNEGIVGNLEDEMADLSFLNTIPQTVTPGSLPSIDQVGAVGHWITEFNKQTASP